MKPSRADRQQLAESPVPLSRLAGLFRPHRWTIGVVMALIVASSTISLAQPFLIRAVIDDALPHQDVRLLVLAVAGMLAVTVASSLLGVVQTWLSTGLGQQIMHTLRTHVFDHLQRQSMDFFTRTRGGEVQSRLTNDIGAMQSVVTNTATSVASNVTTAVGTAVAMVALSWRLSLLSLLVIPPAVWLTRRVALLRREITASSSAGSPTCRPRSTRACRSAASCSPRPSAPSGTASRRFERDLHQPGRPRDPLPARRPLADGDDEHRLRRDPGRDLPRRRASPRPPAA